MINKYQQGGKQEAIMQFIQGLAQALQADPQQVAQIAQQNPEAFQAAAQAFQETNDIKKAAQVFAQAAQKKAQAARHGAKLQYLKSLKHQCAEDEELYYYKRGGSVNCGCKKKEHGGEVEKTSNSTVEKFKTIRKGSTGFKNDDDEWTTYDPKLRKTRKMTPQEIAKAKQNQKDAQQGKGEGDYIQGPANKSEITKKEPPTKKNKTVKAFKEKCGAKMKKHKEGGSLNGTPFIKRENK